MAPIPCEPNGTLLLERFTIRPRHTDAYLALWPRVVASRERHGYTWHRAFIETDAEPKVSWLLSHPDPAEGAASLEADAAASALAAELSPHVFRNRVVRLVRREVLTRAEASDVDERIAIMRRYHLTGDWPGFLELWRPIVGLRERYGFRCLFAVADEPHDLFTWAFDFAGTWAEFPGAQRDYYHDPDRVALRGVFDHMADYDIHPARQVLPEATAS